MGFSIVGIIATMLGDNAWSTVSNSPAHVASINMFLCAVVAVVRGDFNSN